LTWRVGAVTFVRYGMFRKLASYIRQQHIGLLALFVALGGSAYAAATINSQNVVDNSLTGNDIRGRNASRGKPFTEGTLTGQDVRGSVGAPGRPAVNGSLTGADIGDQSLTGADVAGKSLTGAHIADGSITGANIFGKSITAVNIADGTLTGSQIADKSLGGGKIADNSLTGTNIDESSLGTVPNAGNSALLGGLAPGAYGTAVRSAAQPSSSCDTPNTGVLCAPVTVQVPEGRSYDAIVWSSISAFQTDATIKAVNYCPAVAGSSGGCLTPSGGIEDGINLSNNYSESGAAFGTTSMLGHHLGPGLWTFGTTVKVASGSLDVSAAQQVHTTVLVFDAAGPQLPVDETGGGSSGTSSGGSSGTSSGGSSGTSSGGSSGTSSGGSSGTSSGGSSGTS
jgi:uncharacterized protein YjbI with pentapeptide repeats